MEEKTAVAALAALSQPVRLRVFRALVGAGHTGMTPGTLAAMLDTAATTLSFHLKELTHADLISQERDGRNLIYRVNFDRMRELLGFLTEHCCQGEPCGVSGSDCQPRRRRNTRSQA
jgi:ArsR family transcriptional regulator, arsenate/arsenite/antimonite-responsive transcriptional repressor